MQKCIFFGILSLPRFSKVEVEMKVSKGDVSLQVFGGKREESSVKRRE